MSELKGKVLRVQMTVDYFIPDYMTGGFTTLEELKNDWFARFPMSSFHATRDTSKIGGSEVIQSVVEVEPRGGMICTG